MLLKLVLNFSLVEIVLVRYDAVTYLKYLDTLRVSEGVRSVWIFADSSYKIFELAKKRVYQMVREDGTKISVDTKSATRKRKVNNENKKETGSGEFPLFHLVSVLFLLTMWVYVNSCLASMYLHTIESSHPPISIMKAGENLILDKDTVHCIE